MCVYLIHAACYNNSISISIEKNSWLDDVSGFNYCSKVSYQIQGFLSNNQNNIHQPVVERCAHFCVWDYALVNVCHESGRNFFVLVYDKAIWSVSEYSSKKFPSKRTFHAEIAVSYIQGKVIFLQKSAIQRVRNAKNLDFENLSSPSWKIFVGRGKHCWPLAPLPIA